MDTSRWWNAKTVAVVTGGNKGIGFEVCKQLAEKGLMVVLTARNESRGHAAVETLKEQGLLNIVYHQLDVQDEQSIATFASWLLKEQGGLDILINNAAISGVIIDHEYIKENNVDPMDMVNLESIELQQKLDDVNNLSERCIDDLLDKYLDDVKSKSLVGKGWPLKFSCYKMSKVALHAYTRILAKGLEKRPSSESIFANCVHPGFVRTDINFHIGHIDPPEGAENVVGVVLIPPQVCPFGKFFHEKTLAHF